MNLKIVLNNINLKFKCIIFVFVFSLLNTVYGTHGNEKSECEEDITKANAWLNKLNTELTKALYNVLKIKKILSKEKAITFNKLNEKILYFIKTIKKDKNSALYVQLEAMFVELFKTSKINCVKCCILLKNFLNIYGISNNIKSSYKLDMKKFKSFVYVALKGLYNEISYLSHALNKENANDNYIRLFVEKILIYQNDKPKVIQNFSDIKNQLTGDIYYKNQNVRDFLIKFYLSIATDLIKILIPGDSEIFFIEYHEHVDFLTDQQLIKLRKRLEILLKSVKTIVFHMMVELN